MQHALQSQGLLLGQHDHLIRTLLETNQQLSNQVSKLTSQVADLVTSNASLSVPLSAPPPVSPGSAAPAPREPPVTSPEPFAGELNKCRGFLLQCRLVFAQKPHSFASETSKVQYALGLLRGRALVWAEAVFTNQRTEGYSFDEFSSRLKTVFDHPDHAGNASKRLLKLRQGTSSVADYSIEFWTLAADSKWNDEALQGAFVNGLSDPVKDELAVRDEPTNLHSLVSLAIKIDNRLRERRRDRSGRACPTNREKLSSTRQATARPAQRSPPFESSTMEQDEPMQLGRAKLSPAERQLRLRAGECLYCGDATHFLANCPIRPKDGARK